MKAYLLSIANDDDAGQEVVFADNATAAKGKIVFTDLYYEKWIDIRAKRYKPLDDMENESTFKRHLIQWRNGWYWVDTDTPDPDAITDEEFEKWYKENILIEGWHY